MLGVVILLLMMATAFMGYVLPWGQMSYWGATVITNLFSAIPLVGDRHRDLAVGRLRGRQPDAEPLLQPALPAAVRDRRRGVPARRGAAHHRLEQPARHRREEPAGHAAVPSRTTRSRTASACACSCWCSPSWCSSRRTILGDPDNYIPANPLVDAGRDRAGMVLPAVLRDPALGAEQAGRRAADVRRRSLVLFVLPWLDTSPVRSARFRPIYRQLMFVLVVDVVRAGLGRRASRRRASGW